MTNVMASCSISSVPYDLGEDNVTGRLIKICINE